MIDFPMPKFLSVEEAANYIGCTSGRVRQMLRNGDIQGQKVHERSWIVPESEAAKVKENTHKVGRPRKNKKTA